MTHPVWITVDLKNNDHLLVGAIYISPSGNRSQSMLDLSELLESVCQSRPSHLLIVGDFNVPKIDLTNVFSAEPEGHHSHTLINCIQDCFFTQHVTQPTRFRPGQPPSILDMILTNEEGMVNNLSYLPGLGRSDHIVLQFTLACYTELHAPTAASLNYNKGNYDLLRGLLREVDWYQMHDMNMHEAYNFLKHRGGWGKLAGGVSGRPPPVRHLTKVNEMAVVSGHLSSLEVTRKKNIEILPIVILLKINKT